MEVIPADRLRAKEAAAYLGITEGTLAVWRSEKRYAIPYLKVGGLVQYRKSDLDAWLASRVVGAPGAAGRAP
jgi:excisionase family DNA binding protein